MAQFCTFEAARCFGECSSFLHNLRLSFPPSFAELVTQEVLPPTDEAYLRYLEYQQDPEPLFREWCESSQLWQDTFGLGERVAILLNHGKVYEFDHDSWDSLRLLWDAFDDIRKAAGLLSPVPPWRNGQPCHLPFVDAERLLSLESALFETAAGMGFARTVDGLNFSAGALSQLSEVWPAPWLLSWWSSSKLKKASAPCCQFEFVDELRHGIRWFWRGSHLPRRYKTCGSEFQSEIICTVCGRRFDAYRLSASDLRLIYHPCEPTSVSALVWQAAMERRLAFLLWQFEGALKHLDHLFLEDDSVLTWERYDFCPEAEIDFTRTKLGEAYRSIVELAATDQAAGEFKGLLEELMKTANRVFQDYRIGRRDEWNPLDDPSLHDPDDFIYPVVVRQCEQQDKYPGERATLRKLYVEFRQQLNRLMHALIPADKLEAAAKQEEAEKTHRQTRTKTPRLCRLRADIEACNVWLDGTPFLVPRRSAIYVQAIIDNEQKPGRTPISGRAIHAQYPEFPANKVSEYRNKLPPQIRELIRTDFDGSILLPDAWTSNP